MNPQGKLAGWRPREALQLESKGSVPTEALVLSRGQPFSIKAAAHLIRPTHIMEDILLYSKSADLSVTFI